MLAWKNERKGSTALLVKGARRVGKSTLVQQFAKEQYWEHDAQAVGIRCPRVGEAMTKRWAHDAQAVGRQCPRLGEHL